MSSNGVKYSDFLARYYVLRRLHMLAAHVLLRLAERRSTDGVPTLEQRCQYLSNAVLQAKSASNSDGLVGSARGTIDDEFLDLLEGKLADLRFQIKIKEELEAIASVLKSLQQARSSKCYLWRWAMAKLVDASRKVEGVKVAFCMQSQWMSRWQQGTRSQGEKGFHVLPRKDGRGVGAHTLDIGSGFGGPTLCHMQTH